MLVSSMDSTLRLLDKDSGELLGEYSGHKNSEYRIDSCMNHTDTHVVSGSEDGRICFWDLVEVRDVINIFELVIHCDTFVVCQKQIRASTAISI